MKYPIFLLVISVFLSCTELDNPKNKESCDFTICEDGRNNIDTLQNAYGVLMKRNDSFYIEVTSSSFVADTMYISCLAPGIVLPPVENYVKFSGMIKDPCSIEHVVSRDSLFLREIEVISPTVQQLCDTKILQEGFDISKNDDKLSIHHLSISDDCLSILISYRGNCDKIPELSLHNSGDIQLGNAQITVNLQGAIADDCNQENYALVKFNLSPLWDDFDDTDINDVVLYFQSQGMFRMAYSKL